MGGWGGVAPFEKEPVEYGIGLPCNNVCMQMIKKSRDPIRSINSHSITFPFIYGGGRGGSLKTMTAILGDLKILLRFIGFLFMTSFW